MGRIEVNIRHGGGAGGPGGAMAVLAALIVLAVARGTAHGAATGALHALETAVEVIVWTFASAIILAVGAGVTYLGLRIRHRAHPPRTRPPWPGHGRH